MSRPVAPDRYVLHKVLAVALGGFLFGFDAAVISGVVPFVAREFALGEMALGWVVASLTLTATLSIMVSGPLADRYGRRRLLRVAAVVFTLSALLSAFASDFPSLILARLLSGLAVGVTLVVVPMYIAEISPPSVRGRMVSIHQLHVVAGISLAYFSNYFIVQLGQSEQPMLAALRLEAWSWRWMLGIGVLPSLLFFLLLFTVPESPRWLAMHGRMDAAQRILTRAHGVTVASHELQELQTSLTQEKHQEAMPWRELASPALRRVLIIGLGIGILQQITGINAVFFYAPLIFEQAGASTDAAFAQAVYVGLVNFVFTLIAMLLIDRLGRRPLLLWGTAGITMSLGLLAWGFHGAALRPVWVLTGMLTFVASFALSLGLIMWVLFSEIFPNRVRGLAISFVGLVNSLVSFAVQLLFPWQLAVQGDSWPWLIYAGFALLGLLFIARQVPETRGRSLEELEQQLVRRR